MEKDVLNRIADALERIVLVLEENYNTNVVETISNSREEDNVYCEEETKEDLSELVELDESVIMDFLKSKSIEVKYMPERETVDEILSSVAFFMGSRYSHIQKVYDKIKISLSIGRSFKLEMKNFTQLEVSNSCQLCTLLSNIAFLSDYKYYKSPRYTIVAAASRIPLAINFLTGHWLELYVKKVVLDILGSLNKKIDYSCIINPQVVLPNGNDFEFDVMYFIEGKLYWIEAKTGNYQNYIDKYSRIAKLFGENEIRPYMVLADLPSVKDTQILSKLFNMNVCYNEQFPDIIKVDILNDIVN